MTLFSCYFPFLPTWFLVNDKESCYIIHRRRNLDKIENWNHKVLRLRFKEIVVWNDIIVAYLYACTKDESHWSLHFWENAEHEIFQSKVHSILCVIELT